MFLLKVIEWLLLVVVAALLLFVLYLTWTHLVTDPTPPTETAEPVRYCW